MSFRNSHISQFSIHQQPVFFGLCGRHPKYNLLADTGWPTSASSPYQPVLRNYTHKIVKLTAKVVDTDWQGRNISQYQPVFKSTKIHEKIRFWPSQPVSNWLIRYWLILADFIHLKYQSVSASILPNYNITNFPIDYNKFSHRCWNYN